MQKFLRDNPGVEDVFAQMTPLGRLATSAEIADAVLFLASPASRFVAGIELFVDGGVMAV